MSGPFESAGEHKMLGILPDHGYAPAGGILWLWDMPTFQEAIDRDCERFAREQAERNQRAQWARDFVGG